MYPTDGRTSPLRIAGHTKPNWVWALGSWPDSFYPMRTAILTAALCLAPLAAAQSPEEAPPASAASEAEPDGKPLVTDAGYVPVLPGPWEGQYRSGMQTASRGAVTAGAGLASLGTGVVMIQRGNAGAAGSDGLVVGGALLAVAGGIGLLTGAPMMGFGAERSHRALVRSGVRVTGIPGDLSSIAWLGMMVVNLVNVWGNPNDELLYAQGFLFVAAYGLAATQMQLNTNAYWSRRRVVAARPRVDLRLMPFVTPEARGLALSGRF